MNPTELSATNAYPDTTSLPCSLPCSPTLGTTLKPLTRRIKAASGTGTTANPYVLVVPVTQRSEWTVQAVTGSNVNGASDADDWATPVPTGGLNRWSPCSVHFGPGRWCSHAGQLHMLVSCIAATQTLLPCCCRRARCGDSTAGRWHENLCKRDLHLGSLVEHGACCVGKCVLPISQRSNSMA